MADDWTVILTQLPPGMDVFDYIEVMLTAQVYPDRGHVFWSLCYFAGAVLFMTLLLITCGFWVRIKNRGWAWMIVHDGACSHINPKAWVPLLWGLMSGLLIGQVIWMRKVHQTKSWTGAYGAYAFTIGLVPVLSFAGLTMHVLTKAPIVRRALVGLQSEGKGAPTHRRPFIVLHLALFLWCTLVSLSAIPSARMSQKEASLAGSTYRAAIKGLHEAKETGSLSALTQLAPLVEDLKRADTWRKNLITASGLTFSCFFILYVFAAILPTILLHRYVRKRIGDTDPTASTDHELSNIGTQCAAESVTDVRVPLSPKQHGRPAHMKDHKKGNTMGYLQRKTTFKLPKDLPKDRPFQNIIAVDHTSDVPQHLQRIIDMPNGAPGERSRKLRRALKRERHLLLVHCSLLIAMGSLAFFMLTGVPKNMDANTVFIMFTQWELWSFAIPACLLAGIFVYDSLQQPTENHEDSIGHITSSNKSKTHVTAIIQLSQQVSIMEKYGEADLTIGDPEKQQEEYKSMWPLAPI